MENHNVHDKVLDKNISADSKSWSPTSVNSINLAGETVSMTRECCCLAGILLSRMHDMKHVSQMVGIQVVTI